MRTLMEHGVQAPEFAGALAAMLDLLDRLEAALAQSQWLDGRAFSLADAGVLPYVLRLDALAMTPLIEARPKAADLFARVQGLAA